MTKKDFVMQYINADGIGLEIGPLAWPMFPKSEGYNVKVLDYMDREGLVAKYQSDSAVDIFKIEDVDYVWSGEEYIDLTGDQKFDFIYASHVIEHAPDLISFINSCSAVLKDGGVLVLAVPDKRHTFDCYRQCSSLAQIIDAYLNKLKIPSRGTIIEGTCCYADQNRGIEIETADQPRVRCSVGKECFLDAISKATYINAHVWVFTPHSFRCIIYDISDLGLTNLSEAAFQYTVGNEFCIVLKRCTTKQQHDRTALYRAAIDDLHNCYNGTQKSLRQRAIDFDTRYLQGSMRFLYKLFR